VKVFSDITMIAEQAKHERVNVFDSIMDSDSGQKDLVS
jgi:hypothetical protein